MIMKSLNLNPFCRRTNKYDRERIFLTENAVATIKLVRRGIYFTQSGLHGNI